MSKTIKIKKLHTDAKIPTKGSIQAAGYDLYAHIPEFLGTVRIEPHETVKIGTGCAMEIPDGYFGAVLPRSGLSTKYGLRPANTPGCVDSDYRGEVIVALHNDTDQTQVIIDGDRIAQLVIIPYLSVKFEETNELDDTCRGDGGFGSTGI